jgi:hypothetical protein
MADNGAASTEASEVNTEETKENVSSSSTVPEYRDLADYKSPPLPKEIHKIDAVVKFSQSVNFATNKLNNLKRVNSEIVASACGNMCRLLNLGSMQTDYIPCPDAGGVGAVAVHGKYLAMGGIGIGPNIYIFELPSKKIVSRSSGRH